MRSLRTPLIAAVAAGIALAGLTGCSSDSVKQATDLGSSVASTVAHGVAGIDGKAIQDGMSSVAGGIDGALDTALKGANVTSDGKVPDGFPSSDVPLVDGTVLGGGAGPNGSGWVVQVRAGSVDDFASAAQQLADAGYTESAKRADSSSAFGMFRSDGYRVVLTFSDGDDGVTATYIVTAR
ncbi:hypothetical protein EDF51_10271 [Curtobacterium sp. PhB25]|uniref:hypothetical protein n=1 Tax=unclassified Curtobacterium TaxID=257496 RepID=UPI001051E6CE|nr:MULTISPECIES: hypothetical protein [unclassified Curtobacterium]TCU50863.1 hypothetical protein EDF33_1011368 [Curtobacterium sp. PhB146]TCU86533.1 hypothetical protein EDF48_102196 [Curtobacterium sp. PhB191]TDW51177.1 hypothetical protein EDF52_102270 [Curtobacterium sp. PhB42]TDW55977.1 hypothetical protein EDF47_10483 [Curtobacterium sp. PhB190]TDW73247.1 hypothetical protein EDF51_10271 [Curtobacterium sp. PhB25]